MPEPVPDTDQTDTPVDQTENNVPNDLMAPLDPAARGSIITIPAVPLGPSSMVSDPVDSAFAAFNEGLMGVPELEQELVDIEVGFTDIEADRKAGVDQANAAIANANATANTAHDNTLNRKIVITDRLARLRLDLSPRAQRVIDVMGPFLNPSE